MKHYFFALLVSGLMFSWAARAGEVISSSNIQLGFLEFNSIKSMGYSANRYSSQFSNSGEMLQGNSDAWFSGKAVGTLQYRDNKGVVRSLDIQGKTLSLVISGKSLSSTNPVSAVPLYQAPEINRTQRPDKNHSWSGFQTHRVFGCAELGNKAIALQVQRRQFQLQVFNAHDYVERNYLYVSDDYIYLYLYRTVEKNKGDGLTCALNVLDRNDVP